METRGYRSPRKERPVEKGRCAHTKQQYNGAQAVNPRCLRQWREISEYETVACADCSSVQSTDRIGSFRRHRIDATSRIPLDRFESQNAWSKADWTTSRWAAWSHFEVPEAPCRSGDRQSGSRSYHHQRDRGHCELPNPTRRTRTTPHYICGGSQADEPNNGMPEWVASTLSSIAKHMLESSTTDREAVAQSLLGLMVPASRRTTEWSIEQHYRHVRCNEPREQARSERRLATKHEQSEIHNENDDRRDAATRRYQEPPTKWNVRLLIASINVTSAVSGSGGAREHAFETGGLNMTGRLAELDC